MLLIECIAFEKTHQANLYISYIQLNSLVDFSVYKLYFNKKFTLKCKLGFFFWLSIAAKQIAPKCPGSILSHNYCESGIQERLS